ncbi:hypothetical protein MA5S0422_1900 [Mycobacteroides abscessus 5S-0422]|nr:hypothetical protein MA5S0422_1900 [Mycobacteroides abscessus 5S-0422]EIU97329.1 hypothetical protein MA5S0921_1644 [Mycobacteroides abscessus 5S-0921]SHY12377.1 Uncharacterised protein [Mycobacteroides abscessus subsp. abscessus]
MPESHKAHSDEARNGPPRKRGGEPALYATLTSFHTAVDNADAIS